MEGAKSMGKIYIRWERLFSFSSDAFQDDFFWLANTFLENGLLFRKATF